jgi:hypothetical protein
MADGLAKLKLILEVDGQGKVVGAMKEVENAATSMSDKIAASTGRMASETAGATGRMASSFANMAALAALAAEAFAAMKLAEFIKDVTLLAARYETLGVVMKVVGANAGYTASQMSAFQQGLQKTGISAVEARQGLVLMGQAQVDMAKSSALARIAQDAAVIANTNSSEAFNRMMTGISTGQAIILHHMGLMVNFEKGYLDLAHSLGKTTTDLTENEKTLSRVNEVMRAAVGISGSYEAALGTAGKQLNSMKRYWQDLMVAMGASAQGPLLEGVIALTNTLKFVTKHFDEIKIGAMVLGSVIVGVFTGMAAQAVATWATTMAVQFALLRMEMIAAGVTMTGFGIATAGASIAMNALKVAFATNPVGIIITALTIAIGLWMTYTKAQSDALDKSMPKDNPVLVNLREETSLLQTKIDLIKKSKGLETITDPQVMELKRLEMQKQFVLDQNGGGGTAFRVAAIEMERKELEKGIPVVAALRKEYAALTAVKAEVDPTVIDYTGYLRDLEHFRESYRSIYDAQDKADLAAIKNSSAEQAAILQNRYNQGLMSEQQFLDDKYKLEKIASDKDLDLLMAAAARAAAAYGKANTNPLYTGQTKDGSDNAEAANDAVINRNKALKEWVEAQSKVNAAVSKSSEDLTKYTGATVANEDAQNKLTLSMASQIEAMMGSTVAAVLYNQAIEMQSAEYKRLQLAGGEAFAMKQKLMEIDRLKAKQEQDNALAALQNKNAVDAANLTASQGKVGGFGFSAIDAQLAAEKTAIKAKYDMERQGIQDQIALLNTGRDIELDGIKITRDANLAAQELVHKQAMADIAAQNEAKYFQQPALLQQSKDAAAAAEAKYQDTVASATKASDSALSQAKISSAQHTAAVLGTLNKALQLAGLKETQEQVDAETKANRAKLSLAANYTSMAGQFFTELAATQDQTSRQGFESAQAFNLAAAVMSTAAAVMNAFATVPWPMSVAAAALAAATGAIQIATISSTTFGGGSVSVSAPSGSFSSGGSGGDATGSSIGPTYVGARDSQSHASIDRLIASTDNASMALTKVADGLTKFTDLFSSGTNQNITGNAPGRFVGVSEPVTALGHSLEALNGSWFMQNPLGVAQSIGAALFGWGNSFQATGSGVQLGISDGAVTGKQYTDYKKSGGWFSSDRYRTDYAALSDGFADMMSQAVVSVASQVRLSAAVLGTTNGIDSVNIPQARIATAGRSTEDITKDLQTWVQNVGNVFAKTVPGLQQYTQAGEEAYAALIRLSTALQTTNTEFQLIGHSLLSSTLAGGNVASKLQDLMGGAEAFGKAMDTYFTSMFTQREQDAARAALSLNQVNVAFAALGLTVPGTNAAFRNMVNALDVTTEHGATTFAALMEIAPAFAEVTKQADAVRDAANKFTNDLTERTLILDGIGTDLFTLRIHQEDEIKQALLDGMDVRALQLVQDREWANAVDAATGKVKSSISTLIAASKTAAISMVDAQSAILNTWKAIKSAGTSPEATYTQAQGTFNSLLGKTDLASLQALPDAANSLLAASKAYNASGAAYQSDLALVLDALGGATGLSGDADMTAIQKQITLLDEIKKAIVEGNVENVNLLGASSPLVKLVGTWSAATAAQLKLEQDAAAEQDRLRTLEKQAQLKSTYSAAGATYEVAKADLIKQWVSGSGTTATFQAQAQAVYAPVQEAYNAATQGGVTGLIDPGIATATVGESDTRMVNKAVAAMTAIQGILAQGAGGNPVIHRTTPETAQLDIAYPHGIIDAADTALWREVNNGRIPWHALALPAFATGGHYTGGGAMMGELGPEFVDSSPGYVYRADETKALFAMAKRGVAADNYGSDNSELISEIRELRKEVSELKGHAAAGVRVAQAGFSGLLDQGEENNRNGNSLARSARMAGAKQSRSN